MNNWDVYLENKTTSIFVIPLLAYFIDLVLFPLHFFQPSTNSFLGLMSKEVRAKKACLMIVKPSTDP